ncbi:MAG: NIPSNAP family protein [Dehalococcoidia bacterium]
MISQLRIYTINRGMMDQWVKVFTETLIPMQEKHGIKIDGMWVNEGRNQFIWIRSFADAQEMEAKRFSAFPEWAGVRDHVLSHLAREDVQVMESVAT